MRQQLAGCQCCSCQRWNRLPLPIILRPAGYAADDLQLWGPVWAQLPLYCCWPGLALPPCGRCCFSQHATAISFATSPE